MDVRWFVYQEGCVEFINVKNTIRQATIVNQKRPKGSQMRGVGYQTELADTMSLFSSG
jgi:hypothetical protein